MREAEIEAAILAAATKYTGLVMARAIVKEYRKIVGPVRVEVPDFGLQPRRAPMRRKKNP